jgi:Ca2+/Na+ antiporter
MAHYLLQSRQVSTQRCHIAALNPANWSLLTSIILFVIAAVIIGVIGWRQAELVDRLADRTGMGEAIAGALFLGASTSLPGIITSVTTAANGYPELAVSNALGGIAVQTVFLVAADAAYRKANLEHAAASAANIMQGTLLITLLAIPILATTSPPFHIWGINPASSFMIIVYIYGLQMVQQARNEPMWRPRQTTKTETDVPDAEAAPVLTLDRIANKRLGGAINRLIPVNMPVDKRTGRNRLGREGQRAKVGRGGLAGHDIRQIDIIDIDRYRVGGRKCAGWVIGKGSAAECC